MFDGVRAARKELRSDVEACGLSGGLQQWAGKHYIRKTRSHPGRNIYDAEWDVLLLLDACRVDLMEEISDNYEFLTQIGTFNSLGSATWEWMPETFTTAPQNGLRETAYVCASPFSEEFLDGNDFAYLDEVWKYAWDKERGTVPPRPVTDRAISVARSKRPRRLLVHYLQPHTPFLSSEVSPRLTRGNFGRTGENVLDDWKLVHRGERTLDDVWADYRDNLGLVLDDVSLLLDNLDADRVVISSDHGNAAGEYGIYGHPASVPLPCLREVPWVETTASDEHTHEPASYDTSAEGDVESRLEALGYRSGSGSNH